MNKGFYSENHCKPKGFTSLVNQTTAPTGTPNATSTQSNIPVYDLVAKGIDLSKPLARSMIMAEWANILQNGADVFVIKGAVTDITCIDDATRAFDNIIQREKKADGGGADHFAAAGGNDRIWNSLQKLCIETPKIHIRYYAAPAIDAACEAWLGPSYKWRKGSF
ncbi:MAG: hypothetical protein V3U65_03200 [Granulosicoccaceae bacterium]